MRRRQRAIPKRQLQQAIKHGTRKKAKTPGRAIYSHKNLVVVVDSRTKREITSYTRPFDLPRKNTTFVEREKHQAACLKIAGPDHADYCESHTVLIVDISGSMRESDVHGARTRLDSVWYAIAQDFIKNRIDKGQASLKDAISVVLMGDEATAYAPLHNVPTDWVTYNNVLTVYKEGLILPAGHGCYRPALKAAEDILMRYSTSNCALVLSILSDGRPSDARFLRTSYQDGCESILERVGLLASKLGKRLTVNAIGIGNASQFDTLENMTSKAKDYGSSGLFLLPSLTTAKIGDAISSVASSLTELQSDLNLAGRRMRVREVLRENMRQIPMLTETVSPEEFDVYMHGQVVRKV